MVLQVSLDALEHCPSDVLLDVIEIDGDQENQDYGESHLQDDDVEFAAEEGVIPIFTL